MIPVGAAPVKESLVSRVDKVMERWKKATAPMKAKSSHESIPHAVQAPKDVFTQCHPNNRADFQARVDTYSSLYWFAKPAELNLLTCARFGWINTGPDELACKCCHQTVLCRIDSRLGPEGARKVAEGLRGYLTTHHLDTCPWKHNPSPKSFAQVNFWTPESALAEVHATIQLGITAWQLHRLSLPIQLDDSFQADLQHHLAVPTLRDVDEVLTALVRQVDPDSRVEDADAVVVACLVLCGWKPAITTLGKTSSGGAVPLRCAQCNRTWAFPVQDAADESRAAHAHDVDGTPFPKRVKRSPSVAKLHPLHEHRWCV
ncbi:hypothetical protein, variant [Aphanomyces invadans]|uniref:C3HC-type domain-containing protein n=1 Tax=Aphanomyces invadans TaxID=157072 RepID=A0A024UP66_9STRA|nr:hypothetical protein, variant [Aphanomyces invadans]ETW07647.1 hypothetical protein, variant [Aphanomyces invadans]|eukprot:XP_008863740.1 hypothetical protein, variant [Aphanomyces invadans]